MTSAPGTRDRFAFGSNWRGFAENVIDESRIHAAQESLTSRLRVDDLRGLAFLDVGCGSGLFSLAATRLGAKRVRSFDYDSESVTVTGELRDRYAPEADWLVERGDATDEKYCEGLGTFDVVYAWGVLHHTGAMWAAMGNVVARVADGGLFFVAIYNDQGRASRRWRRVKRLYNRLPEAVRPTYAVIVMLPTELRSFLWAVLRGRVAAYVELWKHGHDRGMSRWYDILDWVGGYPFEVAKPEEVFEFCHDRGFELLSLSTAGGGLGNNQFVFRRVSSREP